MRSLLERAQSLGYIRGIDLQAGLFLHDLADLHREEVLLAAVLASRAVGEGHICLPLEKVAGRPVFGKEVEAVAPDLPAWKNKLFDSGVVAGPHGNTPLILDQADRLYLARYYSCEKTIGNDLLLRSSAKLNVDLQACTRLLNRVFPEPTGLDWQKLAAALALVKQFVLISGGPGTGKTHTVARIVALIQALADRPLRIALAAPTGKAAVRLQESIARAKKTLDTELASLVTEETLTIHRLLGAQPGKARYRHNGENPLHLDLLVLDEASMIDVPLMAGVLQALPGRARLIMLGDKDQLTSVEAGSLFGDICPVNYPVWSAGQCRQLKQLTGAAPDLSADGETFGDSIAILQESYRFRDKSGISELAGAVRDGDRKRLAEILEDRSWPGLYFQQVEGADLQALVAERLLEGFRPCFAATSPHEAIVALERFRVLCAAREGPAGVGGINALAEKMLRRQGLINGSQSWYRGRPIMITVNDYGLQLFNGDTGIAWPGDDGRLWAWFVKKGGDVRKIGLAKLPDHETAYAMTVHKAQGSEFEEVLFILPQAAESRLVNRELIYTGITRARKRLTICGDPEVMAKGIDHHVVRFSGLRERLWG